MECVIPPLGTRRRRDSSTVSVMPKSGTLSCSPTTLGTCTPLILCMVTYILRLISVQLDLGYQSSIPFALPNQNSLRTNSSHKSRSRTLRVSSPMESM